MFKMVKKATYIALITILSLICFSCKKKVKHKWIEVGSDPNPVAITPGVHPERGSESNAVKITLVEIYRPMGRDKDGVPQYKKYFYEMEETLTPDKLDAAMKEVGLIGEDSLFCDLVLSESDEIASAGPGAADSMLTKKGTVRYVDLSSPLDNSDNYAGKHYAKDLEGMIDQTDIEYCITHSFEEAFQLVSCSIEPVDMDEYNKVHNK